MLKAEIVPIATYNQLGMAHTLETFDAILKKAFYMHKIMMFPYKPQVHFEQDKNTSVK